TPALISTLSLHDALPISGPAVVLVRLLDVPVARDGQEIEQADPRGEGFDLRTLRVHEVLVDLLVRLLEEPRGHLDLQVLQLAVRSEEHTSELQSRFDLVC